MNDKKFNPHEHLITLKNKNYLPVAWRLVWFRQEHSNWRIDTELIELDKENKQAIFRCQIFDENGTHLSCGYGSETIHDFKDFIETAETKAVGRALAMLGYGTQFAPELDEEDKVVDAPQNTKPTKPAKVACDNCGSAIDREFAVLTYKKTGYKLCKSCFASEDTKYNLLSAV